ncbi:MAG: GNAT family N-acetyltransferase [Saprospiraceae bacterium]
MKIKKAKPADCPILTQISKAAKAHWGYPEEWLAMWEDDLSIKKGDLSHFRVFKLTEKGVILGFSAISEKENTLAIEHLWIRPQLIGKGLGKYLLQNSLEKVRTESHTTLTVIADPNAVGFYEKFGFETVQFIPSKPEGRQLPLMSLALV